MIQFYALAAKNAIDTLLALKSSPHFVKINNYVFIKNFNKFKHHIISKIHNRLSLFMKNYYCIPYSTYKIILLKNRNVAAKRANNMVFILRNAFYNPMKVMRDTICIESILLINLQYFQNQWFSILYENPWSMIPLILITFNDL